MDIDRQSFILSYRLCAYEPGLLKTVAEGGFYLKLLVKLH